MCTINHTCTHICLIILYYIYRSTSPTTHTHYQTSDDSNSCYSSNSHTSHSSPAFPIFPTMSSLPHSLSTYIPNLDTLRFSTISMPLLPHSHLTTRPTKTTIQLNQHCVFHVRVKTHRRPEAMHLTFLEFPLPMSQYLYPAIPLLLKPPSLPFQNHSIPKTNT